MLIHDPEKWGKDLWQAQITGINYELEPHIQFWQIMRDNDFLFLQRHSLFIKHLNSSFKDVVFVDYHETFLKKKRNSAGISRAFFIKIIHKILFPFYSSSMNIFER